jgi:hypothetical protein
VPTHARVWDRAWRAATGQRAEVSLRRPVSPAWGARAEQAARNMPGEGSRPAAPTWGWEMAAPRVLGGNTCSARAEGWGLGRPGDGLASALPEVNCLEAEAPAAESRARKKGSRRARLKCRSSSNPPVRDNPPGWGGALDEAGDRYG